MCCNVYITQRSIVRNNMCILVSYLQHANWTTLCDCTIFLRMCSLNHYDRVLNNNSKGLQRLAVCPPYSKNHAVRYSSNLFVHQRACQVLCTPMCRECRRFCRALQTAETNISKRREGKPFRISTKIVTCRSRGIW